MAMYIMTVHHDVYIKYKQCRKFMQLIVYIQTIPYSTEQNNTEQYS